MRYLYITSLLLCLSLGVFAQQNIHFVAGEPTQEGISQKTKDGLKRKVEQILARNNAGASSLYNAFVIEPELTITDTRSTEGLIRDVSLVSGEFTLTARNRYDESIYGNVIVDVSGDATGNEEAAIAAMLANLKSNNPAFVRFLRTTRQRIAEYYEQNCACATIILKAQTMINMQQYEDALGYLSSVPETVSCYPEAAQMLETSARGAQVVDCDQKLRAARAKYIMRDYEGAFALLTEISPTSPCGDDVLALMDSINKNIALEPAVVTVVSPDEEVMPEEIPAVETPQPTAPAPRYNISTTCNHIEFEVVSCEGNSTSQIITLYGKFVTNGPKISTTIFLETVIAPDGAKLTRLSQSNAYGAYVGDYHNVMPTGVKLAKVFQIHNVVTRYNTLAYVEIYVDRCKVIIRDLPVTWK